MMNPEAIAQAVIAIVAPLATLIGIGSRRRRLRHEIRENLTLVEEIEKNEVLRDHTPVTGWLQGRIAVDIARLSGQPLGTPKSPVPKGSVAAALVVGAGFGLWTYVIVRDGFVWYSVFPGIVTLLMAMAVLGMVTDRDLPPSQDGDLPEGASQIRSSTVGEQIATSVALAASGGIDERFGEEGQIGVAFRFLATMREGRYEAGLALADKTWLLCRLQSWLWDNRDRFGEDPDSLQARATSLVNEHQPPDVWSEFVADESQRFATVWGSIDPDEYGAASRRRRIAGDMDLVILAHLGGTEGYFVATAMALPDALTFVMRRSEGRWLVANHIGVAPPQPGWPPAWWATGDFAVESLPEAE